MCPGARIVLISMSFPFLGYTRTALKIMDSPSPVEALLGQNVTIPCVLTDRDQPQKDLDLDLATDSVRWEMISLSGSEHKVYLLRNGRHAPYRQNSNVEENEFKSGNASLTLYNVQQSDEGKYVCNVVVAGNTLTAVLKVEVSARPIVTLSSYNVITELGNEQSVTCYIHKFYPEYVKIRWEKRSASSDITALDKETCNSVPTQADDGTFDVTSRMSVKPSSVQEDGDQYFCIVSHRSLKSDYAESFTVTVKEPPTSHLRAITIITSTVFLIVILIAALRLFFRKSPPRISDIAGIHDLVHGKRSNLFWMVSHFKPRDIEIRAYLERGDQRQEIGSWKYPTPEAQDYNTLSYDRREGTGLIDQENSITPLTPKRLIIFYNCLCSTSITPDKRNHEGAELVIEIKHAALKTLLTTRRKLNIKGAQPVVEQITSEHVGEQMKLSCRVHSFHPRTIEIRWFKEKDELPTTDSELDIDEEGLYSTTSVLMYVPGMEDIGKTFRCRVDHQSLPNSKTCEWKLEDQRKNDS